MSSITPAFQGEVQLRRWSESSTQGVQVTFALAESSELERFKGLDGKRFMAVLVQIGDDEQPVAGNPASEKKPREQLGDLCWRAVQWCKDPEFWSFLSAFVHPQKARIESEAEAVEAVKAICDIDSRKELDANARAKGLFDATIRGPYQKHLIARGIVR